MPASTFTTRLSIRTTRTEQTEHTTGTRLSLLSAIPKTLRPMSETVPFFTPANNLERSLSEDEERLVKQVIDSLNPTVLHPCRNFKRPWPRDEGYDSKAVKETPGRAIKEQALVAVSFTMFLLITRLVRLVSDFVNQLPRLLSFESCGDSIFSESATGGSIQLRRIGHGYQAVCLLQKTISTSVEPTDILRLHEMDILSQQRLHSTKILN